MVPPPVLLLTVGVFALRDGLARRSRLLRPEALLLKADNPKHLKGREEDIDRLSALCHEYQQVNLVGESGAGKSALIQAGLYPRLKAERDCSRFISTYGDRIGKQVRVSALSLHFGTHYPVRSEELWGS